MSVLDFNGIWKLNKAKSDIPPVTKNQTLTIETDGFNVTMREELINDKEELLIISLSGTFNGEDNPVNGTTFADTVSYRLLNSNTIEGIAKKDGRVCVKEEAILSEDGNTVNVTYISLDQNGNTVKNFGCFERVRRD
jgi:septin family protein